MEQIRMALPRADSAVDTPLQRALHACRQQFWMVGLFSGVVNLLQLTISIYMMQVFDRVLATRSLDTLLGGQELAGAYRNGDEMLRALPALGPIRYLFGPWFAGRKKHWSFRAVRRPGREWCS